MRLSEEVKKAGFVAIVGRPNVGKSTLLNKIIGQKVAITTHQPQTTRHQIQGIKTTDTVQTIYVDTPGLHAGQKKALNRAMNNAARTALMDVDAVVMVVEAGRWTDEDALVISCLTDVNVPVFLVVNKIDKLQDKTKLLPYLQKVSALYQFEAILPLSAQTGEQVRVLEARIEATMPESVFLFPPDQVLNRDQIFHLSELLREQLMRQLTQELPFGVHVGIEAFSKNEKGQYQIAAVIWVEREAHKPMVIGKQGQRLKEMATAARLSMKKYLNAPVFLQTWVKVKSKWTDDASLLRMTGYDIEEAS